ncbi:MAG: Mur ligase [Holophagaceae bacterium]|uniref:Mur ligase n=1 Tax=Candidatus Geothrix skivensis TaxID=2954439 RepID=A0A9D7SFZ8_9BACT|nr:Mur ligase [Candidatus Geothrix skivensis]
MSGPGEFPFEGSRRLTGPNLYFGDCGAVLEASGSTPAACEEWAARVSAMRTSLGWPEGPVVARRHASGASLALAAPEDQLFTATELNEWAWASVVHSTCPATGAALHAPGHPAAWDEASALQTLRHLAAAEVRPELVALMAASAQHDLPAFCDDELFTLGAGAGSRTWSLADLPTVEAVPWDTLHDIPTALVTGSNGKTTTVRLVAAMGAAHGWILGHSCTDGTFVDGEWLTRGDYSGPAGSRQVLRDPRVQAAVLETARGGILRRGIAVRRAEVAVVTNVTPDHFGEYGVHSLDELAEAKFVVARALSRTGLLVLNADDPTLLRKSADLACPLAWFALDHAHPRLASHRRAGGATCGAAQGRLLLHWAGATHDLGSVFDMPLGAGGAATYNLSNAAGAALAAAAMRVPPVTVAAVLATFGATRRDNPGRLDRWNLAGLRVLMDYAHNPEGLAGLLEVAGGLRREGRLGLLLGQAGNREDGAIRALAATAVLARPDMVVLKDLEGYLRGRTPGEVPALLGEELLGRGLPAQHLTTVLDEVSAVDVLLAWARPGDVLVLPVHGLAAREHVASWLDHLGETGWLPGSPLPLPSPT